MIYTEKNDKGIISFNKSIITQVVNDSVKSWTNTGKLRLLEKEHKLTDTGIYLCVHISLLLGESLKTCALHMIDHISSVFIQSLELEVDDIVVVVDNVFTEKGSIADRNIEFKYSDIEK